MFYLKHKGKRLGINPENVYTTCPDCGKEFTVDLKDVLETGDLYSSRVCCVACSRKHAKKGE